MNDETILEAKNLSKKFDDFTAVDQINFSVIKNEIFGFLGPNGAGKTTTINMFTGLARPTSGSIFIVSFKFFEMKTGLNVIPLGIFVTTLRF